MTHEIEIRPEMMKDTARREIAQRIGGKFNNHNTPYYFAAFQYSHSVLAMFNTLQIAVVSCFSYK